MPCPWTEDTGNGSVLLLRRRYNGEELAALFNFSELPQAARCPAGEWTDLMAERAREGGELTLPGYGFLWLKRPSEQG